MRVQLKRLHDAAIIPRYQTELSAGVDLAACMTEDVIIAPHERVVIPTGIAIALPAGYEAQIRGRSGMALKFGVMPANGVGTIDADYRGEIGVILLNTSNEQFTVTSGMRIAQMVVTTYEQAEFDEVETLDETTRSTRGYGSTGY